MSLPADSEGGAGLVKAMALLRCANKQETRLLAQESFVGQEGPRVHGDDGKTITCT